MKRGGTVAGGSEFDLSDFLFDTYLKLKGKTNNDDGGSDIRHRSSALGNKINPITDLDVKKSRHTMFNGPKEETKVALDDTEKIPINQQHQQVVEEAE
jgi:hypothetical protein